MCEVSSSTVVTWARRAALGVGLAVALLVPIALIGGHDSTARQLADTRIRPRLVASTHPRAPFAVGRIVVPFVDTTRRVHFRGRRPQPRPLVTVIRYPAIGTPSAADRVASPAATSSGPFPLVVFAHGFDATPAIYARLLDAWARAGYVVAAPIFPLTNEHTPGGPEESDLVNQPADVSFVITQMLAASTADHGILSRLVNPAAIAVAGQSDGGATALASADDSRYRDPRIGAAIILSGAEMLPGRYFRQAGPPLLAVQGTADVINLPHNTYDYFHAARSPKFLLRLLGASHRRPYTNEQPQLGVVERVTLAFLDRYLKRLGGSIGRLWHAGQVPPIATLSTRR